MYNVPRLPEIHDDHTKIKTLSTLMLLGDGIPSVIRDSPHKGPVIKCGVSVVARLNKPDREVEVPFISDTDCSFVIRWLINDFLYISWGRQLWPCWQFKIYVLIRNLVTFPFVGLKLQGLNEKLAQSRRKPVFKSMMMCICCNASVYKGQNEVKKFTLCSPTWHIARASTLRSTTN